MRAHRFRYHDEDSLQAALAGALDACGFDVTREVYLDRHSRIDLLVQQPPNPRVSPDVRPVLGIEVKLAGRPKDVLKQVLRYAECDLVDEVLLVTARVRHLALPADWNGKPLHAIGLAEQAL